MAMGCRIIASDTEPVRELLQHGRNGWLCDFFDPKAFAEKALQVLADPEAHRPQGEATRQTILDHYSLHRLLPLHLRLMEELAEGQKVPEVQKEILRVGQAARASKAVKLEAL